MSGFLGQALGGLLGGSGAGAALPGLLHDILGTGGAGGTPTGQSQGGLAGLVQQFEAAGLGPHVASWIGSGQNLAVTAEQVASAIPPEQLAQWAQRLGIPAAAVPALMAQVLPHAVDQATPAGSTAPDAMATPNFGALIGRLFGG